MTADANPKDRLREIRRSGRKWMEGLPFAHMAISKDSANPQLQQVALCWHVDLSWRKEGQTRQGWPHMMFGEICPWVSVWVKIEDRWATIRFGCFPETIQQPWPMSTCWLQSTTGWSWHVPWECEPQHARKHPHNIAGIWIRRVHVHSVEFVSALSHCPIGPLGLEIICTTPGTSKACVGKLEPVPGISLCDSWCLSTRVPWPSNA